MSDSIPVNVTSNAVPVPVPLPVLLPVPVHTGHDSATAAVAAVSALASSGDSSTIVNNQHWQKLLLHHLKQHIHKLQEQSNSPNQSSNSQQPDQIDPNHHVDLTSGATSDGINSTFSHPATCTRSPACTHTHSHSDSAVSGVPDSNSNCCSFDSSPHGSNPPSFYFLPDSTPSYMSPIPPLSMYTISTPRSSFSYPPTETQQSAANVTSNNSDSGSSSSSSMIEESNQPGTTAPPSIPLKFPMLVYTTGETQIDTTVAGSVHRTKYCWVQVSDYGVMYCDGRLLCTLPHLQHHNQQIQSAHTKLMDQDDSPCKAKGCCDGHPYVHLTSQLTTQQWVEMLQCNPTSGSSKSEAEVIQHSGAVEEEEGKEDDEDEVGNENQVWSGNGSIGITHGESGSSSSELIHGGGNESGSSSSLDASCSGGSSSSGGTCSMDVTWNSFEPESSIASSTPRTSSQSWLDADTEMTLDHGE